MSHPTSWEDVNACQCDACNALELIYLNCHNAGEFLFVCDCRMHGRGFSVTDLRRVFTGVAALVLDLSLRDAVAHVLDRQRGCDAFVSTFPVVHGDDFRWRCESFVNAKEKGYRRDAIA